MRRGWTLAAALLLSACGHSGKRLAATTVVPPPASVRTAPAAPVESRAAPVAEPASETGPASALEVDANANAGVCRPDREHLDKDYTPGGLYAPHIQDSAPEAAIDISAIPEPEPRDEPRSRFGNRTPYVVLGKHYRVLDSAQGYVERGVASWYGRKFHGRATSSRETYDMCSFSAAHKTLPLPTIALVTNLDNGRSLRVRINDRGPFHAGRLIDLSYAAAVKLGVDRSGTARVEVRALTSQEDLPQPLAQTAAQPYGQGAPTIQAANPTATSPAPWPRALTAVIDADQKRYVQVGSYGDRDNAQRQAERLREAGLDAVDLDRAEVNGRTVWRVRIGPLRESREIEAALQRARELGYGGARVFSE